MSTSNSSTSLLDLDLYHLLDPSHALSSSSTVSDISRAYRKQARLLHPDKNPNNAEAGSLFDRLQRAYELLSDEKRRGEYDEKRRRVEEKKRKLGEEDERMRRLRQRLHEREAEAMAAQDGSRRQQHHQRVKQENDAIIQQMRSAPPHPPPAPRRPPPPSSFSSSLTVVLSEAMDESALRAHFSRYGVIELVLMRRTKALVLFVEQAAVDRAVKGEQAASDGVGRRKWTVTRSGGEGGGTGSGGDAVQREERKDGGESRQKGSDDPVNGVGSTAGVDVDLKQYEVDTLQRMREMARKKKEEKLRRAQQRQEEEDSKEPPAGTDDDDVQIIS